jgi:DNA polymerase-3 subunit gamma/tau
MSLYQKYRPQTFSDVSGHNDNISLLTNIVKKSEAGEKIPHAYVFSGTHGIGKTTMARIFARDLKTDASDIYELDAASTSKKIEDIRELIESVHTLPILSKYKVYILDEAHMLTKDSSNAFLKTLEEPPAHVIFILCTTDMEKILSTVRSRCNIIKLVSPTQKEIISRLEYICKEENIKIAYKKNTETNLEESSALELIAKNSNSSYRDSITNLEKVIHAFDGVITLENVEKLFGKTNHENYLEIINLLSENIRKESEVNFVENKKIGEIIKWVSQNYKDFSYNTFLEIIRKKIIEEKLESGFYTFKNLLYFLEKENLYKNTQDKFSALMVIFGNFR